MANDINKIILIGRMTRDIECKSTNSGSIIGKFSLASNRTEKHGDSWVDAVGYFECVCFGKRAETLQKYTHKGSKICIDGNLRWSIWEGADGKKNSKVEINVEGFQFLDAKHGEQTSGSGSGGAAAFDSGAMTDEYPPF